MNADHYIKIFYKKSAPRPDGEHPYLNKQTIQLISEKLGLTISYEKAREGEVCFADSVEVRPEFRLSFSPVDLLDYTYAVLHSATFREKYKSLAAEEFPPIPLPKDSFTFWRLGELGNDLKQLHLVEPLPLHEIDKLLKEISEIEIE